MSTIMHYVSTSAGRETVIKGIERFALYGGAAISAIVIGAVFLR